ncbi:hypothetical protein [Mesobacillus campisalis]|uniref:hypothetical protein n=1 Tax=Mesobacillus campisalis TaxID=1408103 RepID=UPI00069A608B|nr:hypothetical protein [Mesobacillus campisalis]
MMIMIAEKTGWSIQWVRNGMELFVLILGWMLGGPIGIGTIFIAFFMGHFVGFSLPQCKGLLEYFLDKKEHKKLTFP